MKMAEEQGKRKRENQEKRKEKHGGREQGGNREGEGREGKASSSERPHEAPSRRRLGRKNLGFFSRASLFKTRERSVLLVKNNNF
jgi:hypothetical protein